MTADGPWVALAVDWNGTIVNDVERAWQATADAFAAAGLDDLAPPSVAAFRTAFTLPMEAFFEGLGVTGAAVELCVRSWNASMLKQPTGLTVGARELLEAAHAARIPVVVVSGADERVVDQDSQLLGVEKLISAIHGSTHSKRDVLRRYAVRGNVAYVGDTAYDVEEGIAAGATTVAVDFGYGDADELTAAHIIVSDLSVLVPLIRGGS